MVTVDIRKTFFRIHFFFHCLSVHVHKTKTKCSKHNFCQCTAKRMIVIFKTKTKIFIDFIIIYHYLQASRRDAYGKWDLLFENNNTKEWIAFKPALGLQSYACYSCKHLFYSKKSFLGHVNRRAIVLKYKCTGCNNNEITFYNR